eukprot:3434795-Pyramimonas_sp.AAC.1
MAPREPQRAQDGHQDGPTFINLAQDSLRHASKRLQDCSKTVSHALRGQHGSKTYGKPLFLALALFRFRWALQASIWTHDSPRKLPETPKRAPPKIAPRAPKSDPRAAQQGPKTACLCLRGAMGIGTSPLLIYAAEDGS